MRKYFSILCGSAAILAGCNGDGTSNVNPTPSPTSSSSPAPTISPIPTPSPTVSPTPTPPPAPASPLQQYVDSLVYTPNLLGTTTTNQQSFKLSAPATLSSIQIAYYQNSANCSSGLNNAVNLGGLVPLLAGTYTSSNTSNYSLCSAYPGGCAGLYATVQGSTAWSMQYTYTYSNGTTSQSDCMVNPTNAIGFPAEFIADYSIGVAECTVGNSCGFSQAYTLPLGWTTQVGASGGTSYGVGITTDASGNFIVTGNTNVGLSGQTLAGTQDYFVAKYDSSGSLIWTRLGGTNLYVYGIGIDESSNSYLGGYTYDALPGETQTGIKDYFIAKYDSTGNLIWNRQVGVMGSYTPGYGITTDKFGNSYLVGTATSALSGQTQNGAENYFIVKYDSNGNLIWTRQVGGGSGGLTRGISITSDNSGNVYATGYTTAGLSGQTQTGTRDYFIVKYDASGNLIWTRQVGSVGGTTSGSSLSIENGNVYVTGYTNVGLSGQALVGTQDYFVAKYDANGNLIWTKQGGGDGGTAFGAGVSAITNGIYVTGATTVGLSGQTQVGTWDYFVAKYDSAGNLTWTKQIGSVGGIALGSGITTLTNGNSYITGRSNAGLSGQTQVGTLDYTVAKVPNQN